MKKTFTFLFALALVRRGVSDAEGVAGLPAGIYIMNGRKIVLK